jgi:hypothetical protein
MFKEECGQCRKKQAEALGLKTRLGIERDEKRQLLMRIKNLEKSLEKLADNCIPQRTGLFDKKGKKICLGDVIEVHVPHRDKGGHWEPQGEPEIKTERLKVEWAEAMYCIKRSDEDVYFPLSWQLQEFRGQQDLIDAYSSDLWIDGEAPGDDDLGYLLENYPPNTEAELMEYLSGCEIVGRDN